MSQRVNHELKQELLKFGVKDWNQCFHCGNCTAICNLNESNTLFPRKSIREVQMGLQDKLISSPEPWLCDYCGDCSVACPRNANPGELMMSVRRWLATRYDWTGLAGIFSTSKILLFLALVLVGIAIVIAAFVKQFNTKDFMHFGHQFEQYLFFAVLSLILVPNVLRMFWFTIVKTKVKAPLSFYISGFFPFVVHMFTQKKSLKCQNRDSNLRWFEHLMVVTGYLGLLIITVFLNWFSTDNPYVIWLGYICGFLVFAFTFDFIIARIRKKKEVTKFSQQGDWLFVIWLFLVGFSAFFVRILVDTNLINENLWLYIIHLIVIAQWGMLIVPFGKWTHFLYRLFAIYFERIKIASLKLQYIK